MLVHYDIAVIGGGPGGYVAAIRASQLGFSVVVIEREDLGGICLNWGCIPTKALLRAAELRHSIDEMKEFGITVSDVKVDVATIVRRSRNVATRLSAGVAHLLKKNKVVVIQASARIGTKLKDGRELSLSTGQKLSATHVIIATGARARSFPNVEPDGRSILTYRDAMVPPDMPKSLIIVGSGAIGSEFASFYNDFGVKVTLIEALDRILPIEDTEVSSFMAESFEKRGIEIMTNAKLQSVTRKKKIVLAELDGGVLLQADRLILAVGIVGNTEELGLEETSITLDRGHIITDSFGATDEAGIYAIGDVTGSPWLAHKASHEGVLCVEKIAGGRDLHVIADGAVPSCTYCRPQVASVGMTEMGAKQAGHDIKVGRFPFSGNGKAVALGDTQGFVKTIFDIKTGELLGAHMVGPEVTELIHGYAIARKLEATEAELMATIFPHPTLSEAMHESVLDAYGRAIHF